MEEEHPIVLPSNGGGTTFTNNRPDDYTILLNHPLELADSDSVYTVSMEEIQFIRALPSVSNQIFTVYTPLGTASDDGDDDDDDDPPIRHITRTITLRRLAFTDTASFVKEINTLSL